MKTMLLLSLAVTTALAFPSASTICYPAQFTMDAVSSGNYVGSNTQYVDFDRNRGAAEFMGGVRYVIDYGTKVGYKIEGNTCEHREAGEEAIVSQCLPADAELVGHTTVNGVKGDKYRLSFNGDQTVLETWANIGGKQWPLEQEVIFALNPEKNYRTVFKNFRAGVDPSKLETC